jgi:Flp pilus assembly protein TadG
MLIFLVMGIAEVGWAFMRTNMIVNAARDGARFGATLEKSQRTSNGCFTGITVITKHVQDQLDEVGFKASSIDVHQPCATSGSVSVPIVQVQVNGQLDLLFPNFFPSLVDAQLQRTVTFADENRTTCTCS